jgi:transposase
MKYFAGLDVSLEETAICVVDETGRIMKELRAASEPDPLVATLQRTGSAAGAHRFGSVLSNGVAIRRAEACRAAGDLHRSPSGQCTDEDYAEQDGTGTMPGLWHRSCGRAGTGKVHVKSRQCRFWRSLLVARRMVLNDAAPPASSAIIARLLRSALAGDVAAQPLAARFRPYLGKLVEAFKAA